MKFLFLIAFTVLLYNQPAHCALGNDTIRKPKVISKNKIVAYKYNYDFTSADSICIDTMLRRFQVYNPAFSNLAANTYLGNLCLPYISVLQNNLEEFQDMLFSQYVRYTMHKPESMVYYMTRQPFTEVNFFSGGPKSRQSQRLNITHTQNANKYLNVGFLVDLNYSDGQYPNQRGKSNALSLFGRYQRNRYSFQTNLSLNTIKNQENGGVYNDSIFRNTDGVSDAMPVKLTSAEMSLKNQNFFFNQRFYLTGSYKEDSTKTSGKWNEVMSLIHQLRIDRNSRSYTDDLATSRSYRLSSGSVNVYDLDFYKSIYKDSTKTYDTLHFTRVENLFQLAINAYQWIKVPAELRFGIKNQIDNYSYGIVADTIKVNGAWVPYNRVSKSNITNTAFVVNLNNRFTKTVEWGGTAEYYFTGYKRGNLDVKGDIKTSLGQKFVFLVSGQLSTIRPGYFLNEFAANNFEWKNDFSNQKLLKLKAGIYQKQWKLGIEYVSSNNKNYVYFDSLALPTGAKDAFTVNSLTLSKLIDWGAFHSEVRATAQFSGNESAISIPKFSGYNSSYVEVDLFKKVLKVQIGYDLFYNSPFYAKAYQPATGMFYSQHTLKMEGYPYTDMFLNIKLKRARFTIKYEHFNSVFQGVKGYFTPYYPITPHQLNFGLSWTFYD